MQEKQEYVLSIAKANALAFAFIVPIGFLLIVPFWLLHGFEAINFRSLSGEHVLFGWLGFFAAVTAGIFVHELLHALGWVFFTRNGWRSIRFGVKWEYLTPYCHCTVPLQRIPFIIGAALPLLVLGLAPVAISYFNGSFAVWFFGFFYTIAAGGDILAIWMLRKVKKGQWVQDHPSELGFFVQDEKSVD
ncbi:MAG: DUF3267 domain-containing protein [Bacteroidota bacterium]|nr:MAG: DUF3267 domain-containing protein [Bacteroidota bacterium]